MFERPVVDPRCVLVSLDVGGVDAAAHLEFEELACSAGAEIVGRVTGRRAIPEPKYFIGAGKAQEVRALVQQTGAGLVLVNHPLSPSQERNLEALIESRVLDRTGLILDIFAQRAQSFEGKLQVELAQLRHLATRLVRGWSHLERQKGGIGLRGPGETQLESDRRMLRARMGQLERRLARVGQQRDQGRALRQRSAVPTVALVGYTNAGKSTLLNALAGHDAAIVTDIPGTTRDLLREHLHIDGLPVTVIDTAGLRETVDAVEMEGIRRARRAISEAELVLYLVDDREGLGDEDRAALAALPAGVERWVLRNKCDLSGQRPGALDDQGLRQLRLSAQQGFGLPELRAALGTFAGGADAGEGAFIARARHVDALDRALAAVDAASARIADRDEAVLAAEDLRAAQDALAEITGRISADELLGRIFAGFCIGK
jgi:GTP-binding protein HflX